MRMIIVSTPITIRICRSYLSNTKLDFDEAIELASSGLDELDWFSGEPSEPDYVLRVE